MTAAPLQNLMDEHRIVYRLRGARNLANGSPDDFAALTPNELQAVRGSSAWLGKRSYEGRFWMCSLRAHVGFASFSERDDLMLLDYQGQIQEILRDPLFVLPGRRSGVRPCQPWLFTRDASDERGLIVKNYRDDEVDVLPQVFQDTRVRVLEIVRPPAEELDRIRWLAGYRFSRFHLSPELEEVLRMPCNTDECVGNLVSLGVRSTGLSMALVRANIYSQLWRRLIVSATVNVGLSDNFIVRAA